MHFASPYYLWLLTALVPMAGYYVWRTLQGGAAIQISSVDGVVRAPKTIRYYLRHLPFVLRAAAEMKNAAQKPLNLMFAALVHDLGKAVTTTQDQNGDYHSYEHEVAGVPILYTMLTRIGAGKDLLAYCANMCRLHMRTHTMNVTFTSPNPDMDKKFCAEAAEAGFVNLKGHRLVGGMRASIYNAMPAEGVDKLVDFMEKFRKENA